MGLRRIIFSPSLIESLKFKNNLHCCQKSLDHNCAISSYNSKLSIVSKMAKPTEDVVDQEAFEKSMKKPLIKVREIIIPSLC